MTTKAWHRVPYAVLQRQHYRGDGKIKKSFTSYHEGMGFLRQRGLAARKIAYQCRICDQWHVGDK